MSAVGPDIDPASSVAPDATPSRTQRAALRAIEAYQRAYEGRPSPCRFYPSCSSYAHDAIHLHGTFRGGMLTIRRLLRCRPLGPSGFDPVPEVSSRRRHDDPDTIHAVDPDGVDAADPTAEKGI